MGHYTHSNYVDWLVVIPYSLLLQPLQTPVSSCCLHSHVFQNGTCVLSLQFAVLADICEVLCYRRSLRAEEIGNLLLRQPNGLVRLAHDNLVLACAHSVFLSMRILYQTSRLCAHSKRRFHRGKSAAEKRASRRCAPTNAERRGRRESPIGQAYGGLWCIPISL